MGTKHQFFDTFNDYIKRCNEEDKSGYDLIFGKTDEEEYQDMENDSDIDDPEDEDQFEENEENTEEEKEMIYITKDTVRKHQFDHNKNTCMTSNYPEIFLNENGERVNRSEHLSFAPGEGSHPTNILTEKD